MDERKSILIITENSSWGWTLGIKLMQTGQFISERSSAHYDATSLNSKINFDCFIIDESFTMPSTLLLIRDIRKNPKTKTSLIYIISPTDVTSLETFKSLVDPNIDTLLTPISIEEIVEKMIRKLFSIKAQANQKPVIQINTTFMNVLVKATLETMEEMAAIKQVEYGNSYIEDNTKGSDVDINGRLVIIGPFFKGSFYISFPKETYLNFYEKVVLERAEEINEQNEDLANEFAKFIYGHTVMILKKHDIKVGKAKSQLTFEKKIKSKTPVVVIPFKTPKGHFYIKIASGHVD